MSATRRRNLTGLDAISGRGRPSRMDALTLLGLFAVTAMLICYALEDRSPLVRSRLCRSLRFRFCLWFPTGRMAIWIGRSGLGRYSRSPLANEDDESASSMKVGGIRHPRRRIDADPLTRHCATVNATRRRAPASGRLASSRRAGPCRACAGKPHHRPRRHGRGKALGVGLHQPTSLLAMSGQLQHRCRSRYVGFRYAPRGCKRLAKKAESEAARIATTFRYVRCAQIAAIRGRRRTCFVGLT